MFEAIGITPIELAFLLAGALAGGIVNGMTGFGTGLTAMPFWLQALPTATASQLSASAGIAGQLTTLPKIWHAIDWRRLAPMVIAGLFGVPVGAQLVPYVDPVVFKRGVAFILIAYASVMLLAGHRFSIAPGDLGAEMVVGFIGGVLGGLAGLSGVAPTIWAALKSWTKEHRRSVFQAYNLTILAAMFLAHIWLGLVTKTMLVCLVLALPATFLGVSLGHRLYAGLSDRRFDRVVHWLLLAAGVVLLATVR